MQNGVFLGRFRAPRTAWVGVSLLRLIDVGLTALSLMALPAFAGNIPNNLLLDPGFEQAVPMLYVPGPIGDGWYVGEGNIEIINNNQGYGTAHSGQQFADLDFGFEGNSLYQTVATTPGSTYAVSFWLSDDVGGNYLLVTFGSSTLFDGLTPDLGSGNYELLTYNVTASDPQTTLTFTSQWRYTGGAGIGAVIDDVSVEPLASTPEPSSLTLFGSGMAGLAMAAVRKFRNS